MGANNKLTDQDRAEIERILVHGEPVRRQSGVIDAHYPTYKVLGARYDVSETTISRIAKLKNCKLRRKAAKALMKETARSSPPPGDGARSPAHDPHTIDHPVPSIDMPPKAPASVQLEAEGRATADTLPEEITDAMIANLMRRGIYLYLEQFVHDLGTGTITPSNAGFSKLCNVAAKLIAQKDGGGDDEEQKRLLRILQDAHQGSPSPAPSGVVH